MALLKEELAVSQKKCSYYQEQAEALRDLLNRAAQAVHTAIQVLRS